MHHHRAENNLLNLLENHWADVDILAQWEHVEGKNKTDDMSRRANVFKTFITHTVRSHRNQSKNVLFDDWSFVFEIIIIYHPRCSKWNITQHSNIYRHGFDSYW